MTDIAYDVLLSARNKAAAERKDYLDGAAQLERQLMAYKVRAERADAQWQGFNAAIAEVEAKRKAEAEALAAEMEALEAESAAAAAEREMLGKPVPEYADGGDPPREHYATDEPMACGHLPNNGYKPDGVMPPEEPKAAA